LSAPTRTATQSPTTFIGGFAVLAPTLEREGWPADSTCDGNDNPPDFSWTAGPPGTVSYALQIVSPEAGKGGFTYWMLANEPADLRQPTPGTGVSGRNDFGAEGYQGPCPGHASTSHYIITVFAVDTLLPLNRLFSDAQFQAALTGHVLASSSVRLTYRRP
jgi:Raf kinase inhibitor-like YbhB/YbcL family protein